MRCVVQRMREGKVYVDGETVGQIKGGLLVLCGFLNEDTNETIDWVAKRIAHLRIFPDENGKLNRSVIDVGGEILCVSNFTLYANLSSRRPDFLQSMKYEPAKKLYEYFLEKMQQEADALREEGDPEVKIFPGVFGGDMKVEIVNDGPITIVVDTDQL